MTEKKPIRVATPPSQGAMEPIRLETARWYKRLREENPAVIGRVHQFTAGDILVHQGETVDGPMAYLVVEGTLAEKQTNFTADQGHVSMTMFHVTPGSVAFVQALSAQFSSQPSFTTVVAETDGEALLLDPEEITKGMGKHGFLLSAQFRLQQQLLVSSWHQKLAHAVDPKLADLVRTVQSLHPHILTPTDLIDEMYLWMNQRPVLVEELEDAKERVQQQDVELKAVSMRLQNARTLLENAKNVEKAALREKDALETALKLAQMEAAELRRESPVAALERARKLMTLFTLGAELVMARHRKAWQDAGLDPHTLDLTEDETKLLLAEEPEGLDAIVERVRNSHQWSDEEIEAAVQLGVPASRSTPPARNEVDELLAFAHEADTTPGDASLIPSVKARPHISTLGYEDVDMAAMRARAAKPLVPLGKDMVSFDLEGGLPRVTPTPVPPAEPKPFRVTTRTLDYSEDAAKAIRALADDGPEIESVEETDILTFEEDGILFPDSEAPTVPQPLAALAPKPVTKLALVKKPVSIPRPAPRPLKK